MSNGAPIPKELSSKISNMSFVCACLVVSMHIWPHATSGIAGVLDKMFYGGISKIAVPIFFCISGIGWLIDMLIYTLLTTITPIPTIVCNIISSIISVTYVYIVSTRKTFTNTSTKRNLKTKYVYYIIYQVCIILLSSTLIGLLSSKLLGVSVAYLVKYRKIVSKIIITPFTMICNFIFMKYLIEKF